MWAQVFQTHRQEVEAKRRWDVITTLLIWVGFAILVIFLLAVFL